MKDSEISIPSVRCLSNGCMSTTRIASLLVSAAEKDETSTIDVIGVGVTAKTHFVGSECASIVTASTSFVLSESIMCRMSHIRSCFVDLADAGFRSINAGFPPIPLLSPCPRW